MTNAPSSVTYMLDATTEDTSPLEEENFVKLTYLASELNANTK